MTKPVCAGTTPPALEPLEARLLLAADVVINEIMYHPYSEALDKEVLAEEYVELLNQGDASANLTGWQFTDGVSFVFPSASLAPGDCLVVAADPAAFAAKYPGVTNVITDYGWDGQLSDSGEDVELANASGVLIDRVHYYDEGDWSVREEGPLDHEHTGWVWSDAHDGLGKSLELIHPAADNNSGQNWAASLVDHGTPGEPNTVAAGDIAPLIRGVEHYPLIPTSADAVTIAAEVSDELAGGLTVLLYHRVDDSGQPFTATAMHDDGLHDDGAAGDGLYAAALPAEPDETIVEWYVEATDGGANTRTWPAPVPGHGHVCNLLYQVDDAFDAAAEWTPGSHPVYRLIMTAAEKAELDDIGDDSASESRSHAQMNGTFLSVDGVGAEVVYQVGIRNRGESTRAMQPNNRRVNFPSDSAWHGVRALVLNAQHGYLQTLGLSIFRRAGAVSQDVRGASLIVNGEAHGDAGSPTYGALAHLEVPGSEYAENHFPDDPDGNVYKAIRTTSSQDLARLDYRGEDPDAYRNSYEKKTHIGVDDWSDLIGLTDVLNNTPDEDYLAELEQVVHVDEWLRYFAVHALLGNDETNLGIGDGDDYYLYAGVEDPRFVLVGYDMDSICNLGLSSGDHTTDSIFMATGVEAIERFLTNGEIVRRYYAVLNELIETVFSAEQFDPFVANLLGGWAPGAVIQQITDFMAARRAYVLSLIPADLTATSDLPVSHGYPYTISQVVQLHGQADAAQTRSVLLNGQSAEWDPQTGTWWFDDGAGGHEEQTLVGSDAGVTYHVPTVGENPTAWTETGFDDSGWVSSITVDAASLLITEIATGDVRFVEIQNVSDQAISTTGWLVLVNDATSEDVNDVNAIAWSLPTSIAAGEVLYQSDDVGDNYWGATIDWGAEGPGWVMIIDDAGEVRDFVGWGYSAGEIASLDVSFGAFPSITVGDEWSGDGAPVGTTGEGPPAGGFVAYNDHVTGGGTHANTTDYSAMGGEVDSGLLKNIADGTSTTVTVTVTDAGINYASSAGDPTAGTDAHDLFDGYVDFGSATGSSIELTAGDHYTYAFTGLDTGGIVTYSFHGTAVRGESDYTTRWTLVTLVGADAFTLDHSVGEGVVTSALNPSLAANQVAIWTGDNSQVDQGYVAGWLNIDPGADGEFAVISEQYTGAIPVSVDAGGVADGSKGYGVTGVRLEEVAPSGPQSWLKRRGNTDGDDAGDFARSGVDSKGTQNPDMTVPFGTVVPTTMGIGFSDDQPTFEAVIATDVGEAMQDVNASLWCRVDFAVGDLTGYDTLVLRMKYDDGFVAYLNGTEVARRNADNLVAWDTVASAEHDNAEAVVFEDIDVSAFLGELLVGTNVLAIHGENLTAADADLLVQAELRVSRSQQDPGLGLLPGLNRVFVEAYDGVYGTGEKLDETTIDIWHDPEGEPPREISGTLTEDTVLDAAGPWTVTGEVTVPAGITLTVEAGGGIYFNSGVGVTVHGVLDARGTAGQRITFASADGQGAWGGFRFEDAAVASEIAYADIDHGDSDGEAIYASDAKIHLDHLTFADCGAYLDLHTASIICTNSVFPDVASGEPHHSSGFQADGYMLFEGNWFGSTTGYNDIFDFTGGNRPGPILRFYNNVFAGGGDDVIDVDGCDAHIEGNVFMHVHQDTTRESKSYCIASGQDAGGDSELTIVRNLFYDVDHALLAKQDAFLTFVNNTVVNVHAVHPDATTAVISFHEDRSGQWPALGAYFDGNILYDVSALWENKDADGTTTVLTVNRNVVYDVDSPYDPLLGVGNLIDVDPLLVDPAPVDPDADDLWEAFALQAGSQAIGAGYNGVDIGGVIPFGASVAGEPVGTTTETTATLTVGGPDIYGYKYKVNDGAWSGERATMQFVESITRVDSTATVTLTAHGYDNGDVVDIYCAGPQEYNGTFTIANVTADTFDITVTGTPETPAVGEIVVRRQEPIELTGLEAGTYTVYVVRKDSAGFWQPEDQATASGTWTVIPPGGSPPQGSDPPAGPVGDVGVSGTLTEDTTWAAADGPFVVTGELVVPGAYTLTIEPGTSVFFEPDAKLTVQGRLVAEGTPYRRIRFTRVPGTTGHWGGLQFDGTTADNRITYAILEYGRTDPASNDGMIGLDGSSLLLEHVTFDHTDLRRIRTVDSSLIVRSCTFEDVFAAGEEPTGGDQSEHIWGRGIPAGGQVVIEGNVFGTTKGDNDAIDFHTALGEPMPQFLGNTFLGGGDDALDLDADALVEGNVFTHFRKDEWNAGAGQANAVAAGAGRDVTLVRNAFHDVDHVATLTDGAFVTLANCTLSGAAVSALNFFVPGEAAAHGRGADVEGSIFHDTAVIFSETEVATELTVSYSLFPEGLAPPGAGNIAGDPRLVDPAGRDFRLQRGSAAIAAGLVGQDMGADVPAGALVSGVAADETYLTDATFQVAGSAVDAYKYRLNGGAWSAEQVPPAPIALTGLADGPQLLEVIAQNIAGDWQDAADAVGRSWTVDSALSRVLINEVLAVNAAAVEHEGTWPDLIELYNNSPVEIDLGGMSLSDDPAEPTKFVFEPGTMVPAEGHLVLYADDETLTSGIHLGFALDGDGEGVYLFDAAQVLLDSVEFGLQVPDLSVGRVGADRHWSLAQPTFGSANIAQPTIGPDGLVINEWFAHGEVVLVDDFIEIYNADALPGDLSGVAVTDRPLAQPGKHTLGPLSFIAAEGFAELDADDRDAPGHVSFRFSADQEMLAIYAPGGGLIDWVVFGPQTEDVSRGLSPDGGAEQDFFRLPTPGVANARGLSGEMIDVDLVDIEQVWFYDESDTAPAADWKEVAFADEGTWPTGAALLYCEDASLPAPKNTELALGATTYYFRCHFTFDYDLDDLIGLSILPVLDDGAIFYLNGTEVYRLGIDEGPIDHDDFSNRTVSNAVYEGPFTVPHGSLVAGDNVLAVEVHQTNSTSTDVVFGMELDAVIELPPQADELAGIYALFDDLRITEIMYHPPTGSEHEFLELRNVGDDELDLTGVRVRGGIEYTFPEMALAPGEYTVIVYDPVEFEALYGAGINVAGQYTGKLDNGGEEIILRLPDPYNAAVLRFEYDDAWYAATDGGGLSLTLVDPTRHRRTWDEKDSWLASSVGGGSPGADDPQPDYPAGAVVINEVLAHTDQAEGDRIELRNTTAQAIDISGWYLSDDGDLLTRFRIPDGTVLQPAGDAGGGDYVVFDQVTDFGPSALPDGFGLDEHGDKLFLSSGWAGQLGNYRQYVEFGATARDVTLGRYTTSTGRVDFVALSAATWAGPNAAPNVGPVVFEQIMYHPPDGRHEFVLLRNVSGSTVELFDPANPDNTWKFTDGIEFVFPTGVTIPAGGRLLVADLAPAAFRDLYHVAPDIQVFGPFTLGSLSNGGETVTLSMPGEPDPPPEETVPYIAVESVNYDDDLPWPEAPDGDGPALLRIVLADYGSDPVNWTVTTTPTVTVDPLATSDRTPALTGTVDDPAATVIVTVAGQTYTAANHGDGTWTLADDTIDPPLANATYDVQAEAFDEVGRRGTDGTTDELTVEAVPLVVARHIFYNRSAWDGNNAAANDDGAIAPSPAEASDPWLGKTALLPGGTATFQNYTSYSRGINGIMIDVESFSDVLSIDQNDFDFRVGNDSDPAGWDPAPAPVEIAVRAAAGEGGSDRITIIWADNAIEKQWLQVTVKATASTGLASPDVFYWGNAIGETGNDPANAYVNSADRLATRANPHNFFDPAAIDDAYDFDRDKNVNSSDRLKARANTTTFFTALKLIAPPTEPAAAETSLPLATQPIVLSALASCVPTSLPLASSPDGLAWRVSSPLKTSAPAPSPLPSEPIVWKDVTSPPLRSVLPAFAPRAASSPLAASQAVPPLTHPAALSTTPLLDILAQARALPRRR